MKNKIALLEAILFTTTEPLTIEKLQRMLKIKRESIEKLLEQLENRYSNPDFGIKLSHIGGYKLVVKDEFLSNVADLTPHADLSRGLLRVLSIIAYHEPIKQSDIVKIIGNRTYEYVKELENRGFVKSEKKSKTKILSVTKEFESYFSLQKDELKKALEKLPNHKNQ